MIQRDVTLQNLHEGHYLLTIRSDGHRLWAVQPNGQIYTDTGVLSAVILAMFHALNAEVEERKQAAIDEEKHR